MQYQFYDLKNVSAGKIVEVQLEYAANVRVMDRTNYLKFKAGTRYKFMGGYVKQSPFRAEIPRTGH